MADHRIEALAKDLGQALTFQRVIEAGRKGVDVDRQAILPLQAVVDIL